MEDTIKIAITTKHLKESHGYIFDDCPLKLAIQDAFPTAFVIVGGPKVTIILNKNEDKVTWQYKPSSNYGPHIDNDIVAAKKSGEDFYMEVTLLLIGTGYNYFQHEVKDDHVVEEIPQLPHNLFAD